MRLICAQALAVLACGCAFQNHTEDCSFPSNTPLYETNASALKMLMAWPHSADSRAPSLLLNDAEGEPFITVGLMEIVLDSASAISASKSECGQAEIHEYGLVIDEDAWASYWQMAKESSRFFAGVVMPGVDPVVARDSTGFGLADRQTGEFHWVCGCLAK